MAVAVTSRAPPAGELRATAALCEREPRCRHTARAKRCDDSRSRRPRHSGRRDGGRRRRGALMLARELMPGGALALAVVVLGAPPAARAGEATRAASARAASPVER